MSGVNLLRRSVGEDKEKELGLQGVAYIAATPARKSRARALPPVAEAEYGP